MLRYCLAPIGLTLCALIIPVTAGAASSAEAVVTALHTSLTDAMTRSVKLGCEGRLKLLQPSVDQTFDLPFVAERALRRHWKRLDSSQQQAFTAALRRSFSTTYATEFSSPGSVEFTTGNSEILSNGDVLVHTSLTPKGSNAITLDYVLKPHGSEWRVVNVMADGVSDLALRATQYDGMMKSQGFDALMARLEQQTQTLKARCS